MDNYIGYANVFRYCPQRALLRGDKQKHTHGLNRLHQTQNVNGAYLIGGKAEGYINKKIQINEK